MTLLLQNQKFLLHVLCTGVRCRPCNASIGVALHSLALINVKPSSPAFFPSFSPCLSGRSFCSSMESLSIDEDAPCYDRASQGLVFSSGPEKSGGSDLENLDVFCCTEGGEKNLSRSRLSQQLIVEEAEILSTHGVKTPTLELNVSLDNTEKEKNTYNLSQGSPAKEENTEDANMNKTDVAINARIKHIVEEQGQLLQAMQHRIDEYQSIILSISKDVQHLKDANSKIPPDRVTLLWPEWTNFISHLNRLGYFTDQEEQISGGVHVFTDPSRIKRAFNKFAWFHMFAVKGMSDEHLKALLMLKSPFDSIRCAFAQRKIRHYLKTKKVGPFDIKDRGCGLLDVIQLIFCTAMLASKMDTLSKDLEVSVRHLLQSLIALTDTPYDAQKNLSFEMEVAFDGVVRGNQLKALREAAAKGKKMLLVGESKLLLDSCCADVIESCDDDENDETNIVSRASIKNKFLFNVAKKGSQLSCYDALLKKEKRAKENICSHVPREHVENNCRPPELTRQNTYRIKGSYDYERCNFFPSKAFSSDDEPER